MLLKYLTTNELNHINFILKHETYKVSNNNVPNSTNLLQKYIKQITDSKYTITLDINLSL